MAGQLDSKPAPVYGTPGIDEAVPGYRRTKLPDPLASIPWTGVLFEIHFFILDRAPQSFRENIV